MENETTPTSSRRTSQRGAQQNKKVKAAAKKPSGISKNRKSAKTAPGASEPSRIPEPSSLMSGVNTDGPFERRERPVCAEFGYY